MWDSNSNRTKSLIKADYSETGIFRPLLSYLVLAILIIDSFLNRKCSKVGGVPQLLAIYTNPLHCYSSWFNILITAKGSSWTSIGKTIRKY